MTKKAIYVGFIVECEARISKNKTPFIWCKLNSGAIITFVDDIGKYNGNLIETYERGLELPENKDFEQRIKTLMHTRCPLNI